MPIHSTAVVDPSAKLADDVQVGAYAFIGPDVELGPGCVIQHHATIEKLTTIGPGSEIWPYATVGSDPQDLKYAGGDTTLQIGAGVRIRECCTVNRGTEDGGGVTKVGDGCLLMAYSHVAHDCFIGDNCILANATTLAGHILIEENVTLGGLVAVHQFTRIGAYCFVGGTSAVAQDLPPYTLCEGNRAKTHGLNTVGLKRAGFSPEAIAALKAAYRIIFRTRTPMKKAIEQVRQEVDDLPEVRHMLDFIAASERGVSR